jgi:hypothetical protein
MPRRSITATGAVALSTRGQTFASANAAALPERDRPATDAARANVMQKLKESQLQLAARSW